MYDGATSSIQLNGNTYGPIPIRCAIRQGCPMIMVLYALCLHPLLQMLEQRNTGHSNRPTRKPYVSCGICRRHNDFNDLNRRRPHHRRRYTPVGNASGSLLNPQKSSDLAVGTWGSSETVLGINPYPTAFPYGNSMVLHFYQQQESSTTKTVHKVINKGLKAYV